MYIQEVVGDGVMNSKVGCMKLRLGVKGIEWSV